MRRKSQVQESIKEEGQIEEIIKNMTKKNHTMPTSQIRFHVGRFTTVYNNKTKKLDMMAAGIIPIQIL